MTAYRILLVEDQSLVRASLKGLLETTSDLRVTAAVATLAEARRCLATEQFDVILCDFNLKQETALDLLLDRQRPAGTTPVVILTSLFNAAQLQRCMTLGAQGFLYKESEPEIFIKALSQVIAGQRYFGDPQFNTDDLVEETSNEPDIRLTPAEKVTLQWLATGMSNKQIALSTGKSRETVKAHVAGILRKLRCANRTEAVTKASLLNLLA